MTRKVIFLICMSSTLGGGFAACVLHVPQAHAGSGYPKEVTAQGFRLVDAAGNCRGGFWTDPNAGPMLTLTDGRGFGILLEIGRDGSRNLRFFDPNNKERVRLSMSDRRSALTFLTPQGEATAHLGNMNGLPHLIVGEATGSNCLIRVQEGVAKLTLANPKCKGSVNLTAAVGAAQVSVGSVKNKTMAALVYDDANTPSSRVGVIRGGEGKWVTP